MVGSASNKVNNLFSIICHCWRPAPLRQGKTNNNLLRFTVGGFPTALGTIVYVYSLVSGLAQSRTRTATAPHRTRSRRTETVDCETFIRAESSLRADTASRCLTISAPNQLETFTISRKLPGTSKLISLFQWLTV